MFWLAGWNNVRYYVYALHCFSDLNWCERRNWPQTELFIFLCIPNKGIVNALHKMYTVCGLSASFIAEWFVWFGLHIASICPVNFVLVCVGPYCLYCSFNKSCFVVVEKFSAYCHGISKSNSTFFFTVIFVLRYRRYVFGWYVFSFVLLPRRNSGYDSRTEVVKNQPCKHFLLDVLHLPAVEIHKSDCVL